MLEGKFERLEFQKMLSLPHRKNRSEQEQNKANEKGTERNGELEKMMKKEMNKKTTKNDLS